jgi:prevent-host-death family protein
MTTEVGIFEAKTRLSELVDQVASDGEEIVITKRGKPVARRR